MRLAICMIIFLALFGCYVGRPGFFRSDLKGRHDYFVRTLRSWEGSEFTHQCQHDGGCPPSILPSGLIRYNAVNYSSLVGCTFWYDVDATTNRVVSTGFEGSDLACALAYD